MTTLAKMGIVPRRVSVDVDELVRRCQDQKRPVDSAARAAFAAENLRLEDQLGTCGTEA
jgi:hypothetical protein